jgi:CBS-domain-containing membrane protein
MTTTQLQSMRKDFNTLTTIDLMLEDVWPQNKDAQQSVEKAHKHVKRAVEKIYLYLMDVEKQMQKEILTKNNTREKKNN